MLVNEAKIYQFKAKASELNEYPLYLSNIIKDFTTGDMKNAGLYGYVYGFSAD